MELPMGFLNVLVTHQLRRGRCAYSQELLGGEGSTRVALVPERYRPCELRPVATQTASSWTSTPLIALIVDRFVTRTEGSASFIIGK